MGFNIDYTLRALRMQSCYTYFLFFQLAIILALTGYEIFSLATHDYHAFTFIMEFVITFGFLAEMLTRMAYNKSEFFNNTLNLFDFLLLGVLSILFTVTLIYSTHLCNFECNTILPSTLLTVRYLAQIVRILATIINIGAIRKAATIEICIHDILEGEEEERLVDGFDDTDSTLMRI